MQPPEVNVPWQPNCRAALCSSATALSVAAWCAVAADGPAAAMLVRNQTCRKRSGVLLRQQTQMHRSSAAHEKSVPGVQRKGRGGR